MISKSSSNKIAKVLTGISRSSNGYSNSSNSTRKSEDTLTLNNIEEIF